MAPLDRFGLKQRQHSLGAGFGQISGLMPARQGSSAGLLGMHFRLMALSRMEEMFFHSAKDYAQRQGITGRLKAENQMEWVGRINDCKARAEEVMMAEWIRI